MSHFEVFLGNKAEKQFGLLDQKIRERISEVLKTLEQNPVPFKECHLKKMAGSENSYRIRISSHRVLYEVLPSERKIKVTKIERRSDNTYD